MRKNGLGMLIVNRGQAGVSILLKNSSIEPIRHSEPFGPEAGLKDRLREGEESHVFPDLRPFTEFILRERRVQGDNQRPFLSRISLVPYLRADP